MTYPSASTLRGFEPAFLDAMHQAMNAAAQPAHRPEDSPGHEPPRRTYAPPSQFDPLANHAANRRFLESKDASVAKGEWQAAHQQLLRFCHEHGLADAAAELAHLTLEAAPLSKKTISVADCLRQDFKGALEALAQHVRDERIPMAARRQIVGGITDLSYCLQRQRAELRKAALELGAHLGGLRGEAGVAFVKLSAAHIQELLREEPRLKDQDVTTPHVWLPFAKVLRLPTLLVADAVDDHYSLDIRLYRDVVDRCAAALPRRIDSMAIADWLAGQCLDDAKAMLAEELCGMPPDFQQGAGHCDALERVLRQLALRYGPLSKFSFCQLDEDLLAQRLVDRPSMLAIDMRRKLEKEGVLPPADDRLLHQYTKDGNIHEVRLLEERPYVLVRPDPGSQPFLRPLDGLEANRLLQSAAGAGHRPGTPGPALDGKDRDHLRDHVVRQGLASQARTVALSHPTPERIGHVIEHVVLEDDTVAGWMGSHPEGWDAATLDRALHEILRCRHRAALGKLLSHWTGTGFPESWMRQVRRQAALGRAGNEDLRIQGVHEDGGPKDNLRNAQCELLDHMEDLLGQVAPLGAAREAARQFAQTPSQQVDDRALDSLAKALAALGRGPGRKLIAPVLLEDGGLAGALEGALFAAGPDRLLAELAVVRRLVGALPLTPESARALLQVASIDRFPVPFPLLGAAVLLGRFPNIIAAVFRWTREMFHAGLLDADAVRQILLPDTLAAEHAFTPVGSGPVANALQSYLDQLRVAARGGLLSWADLPAAELDGEPSSPLIRTAIERGGDAAAGHWENHTREIARAMLAPGVQPAPDAATPPPASS